MFTEEAIQKIQEGESLSVAFSSLQAPTEQHLAAMHQNHSLVDLEQYMPNRRRARAVVTTGMIESFAQYVKAHQEPGCSIFIAAQKMQATAVLNLGTPTDPGHADNLATLSLQARPAFNALLMTTSSVLSQQQAAEFLEDWQPHIECWQAYEHTAGDPQPSPEEEAQVVKPRIAIAALRSLTIEQARKDSSTVGNLSASGGSFSSIAAKSNHTIPTLIHFRAQPYAGLSEQVFAIRLGIKTGDAKPTIKLSLIRKEEHEQAMALELEEILRTHKAIKDIPIVVGQYSRSS